MNPKFKKAIKSHLDRGYFKSESYERDVGIFFGAELLGDVGSGASDITTESLSIGDNLGRCVVVAKGSGIFCGGEETKMYFEKISSRDISVELNFHEGEEFKASDKLITLNGSIRDLFIAERSILNIVQRMSGIATAMKKAVIMADGRVLICPTRKTLLGSLDKKACMIGGGGTHRIGLHDAILYKKTHIKAVGGDFEFLLGAGMRQSENVKFIECEVENIEDAETVLKYWEVNMANKKPQTQLVLMLDNIEPEDIKSFVLNSDKEVISNILIEASGGITLKTIDEYANSGVDIISIGQLTNRVSPIDLSFKLL